MKKTIITTLVIMIIASASIFAALTPTDNFTVTTDVALIDKMTVSTAKFTGTTLADYNNLTAYTTFAITTQAGTKTATGWLSTLSNNRKGYSVSMKATAMKSSEVTPAAYINYDVECGGASLTTNNGTTVTATAPVITKASPVASIGSSSTQVFVTVNAAEFQAAVAGSYTGTVTFTYTANT